MQASSHSVKLSLLGGLSAADFLRAHWQKRPLLVRGALPGFAGLLSPPGADGARRPARIPTQMVQRFAQVLARIRWGPAEVEAFAGVYLSEPKPTVVFSPPLAPFKPKRLRPGGSAAECRSGHQDPHAARPRGIYINGEAVRVEGASREALSRVADARVLPPGTPLDPTVRGALYQWYRAGYLALGKAAMKRRCRI
jgi:50S ribosomal protein L16 3-hydroxylase